MIIISSNNNGDGDSSDTCNFYNYGKNYDDFSNKPNNKK